MDSVDLSHHEVMLQRFKLLHLVQQVAKADVEELVRTVGVEALTYRGSGVEDALLAAGVMSTGRHPRYVRNANPHTEQREYEHHIYRDFGHPIKKGAQHQRTVDLTRLPRRTDHMWREDFVDDYFTIRQPPTASSTKRAAEDVAQTLRRRQSTPDGNHLVRSPKKARPRGGEDELRAGHRSHENRFGEVEVPARPEARVQERQSIPAAEPQPKESASSRTAPKVPDAIIHLAAHILAKDPSRSRPASTSHSLNTSQAIRTAHNEERNPAPLRSEQYSNTAHVTFHADTAHSVDSRGAALSSRPGAPKTDRLPEQSSQPSTPAKDEPHRRDVFTTSDGTNEDAEVDATIRFVSAGTMTPPAKKKSTVTQTRGTQQVDQNSATGNLAAVVNKEKGSMPSASEEGQLSLRSAPPTIRLSAVEPPEAQTSLLPASATGSKASDARWVSEAMSALDSILIQQDQIEKRWQHTASALHGATPSLPAPPHNAVEPDRELQLSRVARQVERLMDESPPYRGAIDDATDLGSVAASPSPVSKSRGKLPSALVEKLLAFRKDEVECIRFNESLWNTSSLSQHVFADRLAASLLDDLFEEVVGEVTSVLDEYVEGLAEHELQ